MGIRNHNGKKIIVFVVSDALGETHRWIKGRSKQGSSWPLCWTSIENNYSKKVGNSRNIMALRRRFQRVITSYWRMRSKAGQ